MIPPPHHLDKLLDPPLLNVAKNMHHNHHITCKEALSKSCYKCLSPMEWS